VQGLANNMKWGLDNRIYVAGGTNSDTELMRGDEPLGNLRGKDFSFDPKTREVEFVSGGLQFGHSFDDYGNRFVCSNSNHILHVAFPARYLDRTPGVTVSGVVRSIAAEGAAAPVFRTSQAEPWRIVRTRRRAADPQYQKSLPPTELVATGFFTSATGVTIYRGDAYPEEYHGNAFIGDVGGNLIHRKTVEPNGISFTATRADENVEFITSTDNWFRPVNFVNGPDGCLYILDMYRETIEHPSSIPEDIKAHLDLYSGDDRGRIYRLVPPEFTARAVENLATMSTSDLALQLQSGNAWNRETAQRLLWERGDEAAVGPLARLLRNSALSTARLHALYTLDGMGKLTEDDLLAAFYDPPDAKLAEHALRIAESRAADWPQVVAALPDIATSYSNDERVQFQLALTLGELDDPVSLSVIAQLAAQAQGSPDLRSALLTSVKDRAAELALESINLAGHVPSAGHESWIRQLCLLIGSNNDPADGVKLLNALPDDGRADVVLDALGAGLRRRGRIVPDLLANEAVSEDARTLALRRYQHAAEYAVQSEGSPDRADYVQILAGGPTALLRDTAQALLTPRTPQDLQVAVARALGNHPGDLAADVLLEHWGALSPSVRTEAIDGLLQSADRITRLLAAIEAGDVKPSDLAPDKRQVLLSHPNKDLQSRATTLLGMTAADRQQVIDVYEPALDGEADAERGRAVFAKSCANCHKVGDAGHAVGPELASVANKSPRDLLIAVLDPNREAQPVFTNYTALLDDGRIVTGIIAAETASTVTFRRAEAKEDVILREQIAELQSSGQSLMPVGMEKDVTAEQLADVIAYIKSLTPSAAPQ
jgi:putative membrane-bound dehydrogenase-like protein